VFSIVVLIILGFVLCLETAMGVDKMLNTLNSLASCTTTFSGLLFIQKVFIAIFAVFNFGDKMTLILVIFLILHTTKVLETSRFRLINITTSKVALGCSITEFLWVATILIVWIFWQVELVYSSFINILIFLPFFLIKFGSTCSELLFEASIKPHEKVNSSENNCR